MSPGGNWISRRNVPFASVFDTMTCVSSHVIWTDADLTGRFAMTRPVQLTLPSWSGLLTLRLVTESTGRTVRVRFTERIVGDRA